MNNNVTNAIVAAATASAAASSAKAARLSLRAYGLPETVANRLLLEEVDLAKFYQADMASFCLPELVELFGEQHAEDSLSYAYHFTSSFNTSFDVYKQVLVRLLEIFIPEDIVSFPDRINLLMQQLAAKCKKKDSLDTRAEKMLAYLESLSAEDIQIITLSLEDSDDDVNSDTEE